MYHHPRWLQTCIATAGRALLGAALALPRPSPPTQCTGRAHQWKRRKRRGGEREGPDRALEISSSLFELLLDSPLRGHRPPRERYRARPLRLSQVRFPSPPIPVFHRRLTFRFAGWRAGISTLSLGGALPSSSGRWRMRGTE
jgi:hypothetical protein